ncbi:MFS transporter [Streptomyces sp. NPDC006645]|uniref:MFS transporter n=1 Tax=unclassified Streptomyces TaxID=2593676 RepID=UPI0033B5874F
MPTVPPSSLWRDHDFRRLWLGQTASQFGAQAGQVTLPLLAVVALNADAAQLGALRAAQQIPILLFSLFVGVWVDRRRSRNVMVLADLGRAVALGVIPLAFLFGVLGIPVLLVLAFLVGVLTVFFDVAYQAALVRLVRRDWLAQGNSALEGSRSAAQVGGPALGGALVSLLSAPVAVVTGAFFFTVSCLSIRRIRHREKLPTPPYGELPGRPGGELPTSPYGGRSAPRMGRQILEGLRFVARDPSLRAVGIASALFHFFFAAMMTVYLLFLPRTLQLSGAGVGLVLAAMGPGAVVGSLLAAGLPRRLGHGVVLVSSAVLAEGVLLCVPALRGSGGPTIAALMVVNFLFGVFSQLVDVTVMAVRQAITPLPIQGRVVATLNFVGMGLTPLGSLLGGFLATGWDPRTSLLLTVVGLFLSPVFMALSPLARLGKELPAPGGTA